MPGLIAQYGVVPFTTPVNGDDLDATLVTSHDNSTASAHTSHDADATIHFQSSTLAARPGASTAGRKWITTDGLRVYYDTGAVWSEIAYLPLAGGTVAGATAFTASATFNGGFTSNGASTINSTLAVTGGVTGNLNGTVLQAAQPNITSLGTLTALAVSGNINAQSVTLNGIPSTAGWYSAQNTKGLLVQASGGSNKVAITLDAGNVWQLGDGLPATFNAGLTVTGGNITGTLGTAAQPNVTSLGALASLTLGGVLTFTPANSRIVPGATDFAINNNANTQNNLLITDAGNATIRGTLAIGGALSGVSTLAMSGALSLTAVNHKIIGVGGNVVFRDSGDANDNVKIWDAGDVTIRRQLQTAASTAGAAGLRMPSGVAPGAPSDGDMWYDGTNVKFRVGGTTKTFTLT